MEGREGLAVAGNHRRGGRAAEHGREQGADQVAGRQVGELERLMETTIDLLPRERAAPPGIGSDQRSGPEQHRMSPAELDHHRTPERQPTRWGAVRSRALVNPARQSEKSAIPKFSGGSDAPPTPGASHAMTTAQHLDHYEGAPQQHHYRALALVVSDRQAGKPPRDSERCASRWNLRPRFIEPARSRTQASDAHGRAEPTVDDQCGAVDVARFVGGEEHRRVGAVPVHAQGHLDSICHVLYTRPAGHCIGRPPTTPTLPTPRTSTWNSPTSRSTRSSTAPTAGCGQSLAEANRPVGRSIRCVDGGGVPRSGPAV